MSFATSHPGACITASAHLPVARSTAYAFLVSADDHRRLGVAGIEPLSVDDDADRSLAGGRILIRGPLGLRRIATTRVEHAQAPTRLAGSAVLDSGSRAHISWTLLTADDGDTDVQLSAMIEPLDPWDRLLLALGGRRWMRRRFRATLRQLSAQLAPRPTAAGVGARHPALAIP